MESITITSLERDCIACPTAWIGKTEEGEELYIRYRWGDLSIRYRDDSPSESYKISLGGAFDGHISVYELMRILSEDVFEFDVNYPTEFYGYEPLDCEFDIFGSWIVKVSCNSCSWELNSEELATVEDETVLPPECPDCGGEYTIETEPPEHLQELQEKADETDRDEVISNLEENFSDDE